MEQECGSVDPLSVPAVAEPAVARWDCDVASTLPTTTPVLLDVHVLTLSELAVEYSSDVSECNH